MSECDDEFIDGMITMLQGLKRRNEALSLLGMAYQNSLFQEKQFDDNRQKYLDHIKASIFEAMQILNGQKKLE